MRFLINVDKLQSKAPAATNEPQPVARAAGKENIPPKVHSFSAMLATAWSHGSTLLVLVTIRCLRICINIVREYNISLNTD